MHTRARILTAALIVTAAALWQPAPADAQGRRAVRVVRPRTTVVVGGYYRPYYYYGPLYSSWYFSPYAQWPPYGYYGRGYYDDSASLRLQVSPRETEVFIDGYYAGTVDDFDGVFQRLHIEPGDHDLELYLPGHHSVQQKIYLQSGKTFSVRQTMTPIAAGEPEPVRPAGTAAAPARTRQEARRAAGRAIARDADDSDAFGALAIRVQPGDAEVFIDGERWAGAPEDDRLVVQLAPGVHRIEIRKTGFRSYFTDVTVRSRETAALNVAMNPQ